MRLASRRGQPDLPDIPNLPSSRSFITIDSDEGLGSSTATPDINDDDLYSLEPATEVAAVAPYCRSRSKSLLGKVQILEKVLPKSVLKGLSPTPPEVTPLKIAPPVLPPDSAMSSPTYFKQEDPLPPSHSTSSLIPPPSPLAPPPLASDSPSHQPVDKCMSIEDIVAQMNAEDAAFEATEQRLVGSGWSSELEIENIRRLRSDTRKIWKERLSEAKTSYLS